MRQAGMGDARLALRAVKQLSRRLSHDRVRFFVSFKRKRCDDQLVGVLVEDQFEAADVAAVDRLRSRRVAVMVNPRPTRGAGPRHKSLRILI